MRDIDAMDDEDYQERPGMLRSLNSLRGAGIEAADGAIGEVHDFLFDDRFWMVRYIVVDTRRWLPGRKVLVPPGLMLGADWTENSIQIDLTREEIKDSPDIDTDLPVGRRHQVRLHDYHGWPYYWTSPDFGEEPEDSADEPPGDPHLRSVSEVRGYDVDATDGPVGCVDDFIAEDESWTICYLVVGTRKWLPGRKVLIAPPWVAGPIGWTDRRMKIIMSKESVKNSPEFDPEAPVNLEYEERLYDYYGRPAL